MIFSKRVQSIKPSPTLEVSAKVATMRAEGIDIIGFGAGEPDFDTPENIKAAAIEALKKGYTKYTPVPGINPLKDAIIAKFERENGLSYNRKEIVVSCGAKHSLYNIAMSLFEKDNEIIIPSPYWVSYVDIVRLSDATPVIISTTEESGFLMQGEDFARALTPKTRALILNYPNNPTGATYTREQLEEISEIAVKNNITVISDEVYEKIIYTGSPHVSIASLGDKIKALTITVNALSKTYAMTGWRIGYAAGLETVVKNMTKIQSQSTSNPTSIAQYAGVEALNGPQDFLNERLEEFRARKDYVLERIQTINRLSCKKPAGTFYLFPNFSDFYGKSYKNFKIEGSLQMAEYLLEVGKIALVPGIAFGNDSCLRLSFASSMEKIKEGINRLEEALKKLA